MGFCEMKTKRKDLCHVYASCSSRRPCRHDSRAEPWSRFRRTCSENTGSCRCSGGRQGNDQLHSPQAGSEVRAFATKAGAILSRVRIGWCLRFRISNDSSIGATIAPAVFSTSSSSAASSALKSALTGINPPSRPSRPSSPSRPSRRFDFAPTCGVSAFGGRGGGVKFKHRVV